MGYIQKKNLPAKNVMNCFRIQACPVRSAIMMNCRRDSLRSGGILTLLLNKYFKIKDTVVEDNGRRYRIEIALNISSQEHQKNVVRRYENWKKSLMRDCVLPLEHLLRINRWTSFWNI